MKMNVWSIPETGQGVTVKAQDKWVLEAFRNIFSRENPRLEELKGSLTLRRINEIVSVEGEFSLPLSPLCVLCAETYPLEFRIPIRMDLSPQYSGDSPKRSKDKGEMLEELELNADDLDFTFYEGNEINLPEMLQEQLVLAMPTNFICSPECRGLCPRCGINLNKASCGCAGGVREDSPWAVLKDFKAKKGGL